MPLPNGHRPAGATVRARRRARVRALVAALAGALAATASARAAPAQGAVVRVATGAPASAAPGATVDVPVVLDLAGAPALSVASLTLKVAWDPALLTLSAVTGGPSFGSVTPAAGAPGELTLAALTATPVAGIPVVATLRFQAAAASGTSPISLGVQSAGDTQGQSVLARVAAQSFAVCVGAAGGGGGLWGDVTADGQVDILDAQQIARHVVGLGVADAARLLRLGDVTADGQVDILDAQQIARHVVGLAAAPRVAQPAPGSACAPPAAAAAVRVSAPAASVPALQTVRLAATVVDAAGAALVGRAVTWQSSNPAVATVDASGTVRGLAPGPVTITAASEGRTGAVQLTVMPGAPVTLTVHLRSIGAYPLAAVSSSPAGIVCGLGPATIATCTATFPAGTAVRLTASPGGGTTTTLRGWAGDCTPSGASCTVSPTAAPVVTVTFGATPIVSRIAYSALEFDPSVGRFHDRVFLMHPDSAGAVRLPPGPDPEGSACPSLSPDGRRLAYVPYAPSPGTVVVMNADGSARAQVGPAGAIALPSWHPGGQSLFAEYLGGASFQTPTIYEYPAAPPAGYDWTRDARRLAAGKGPAVGPDASTIAYETLSGTIALMTTDGAPGRDFGVRGESPSWSPDGTRLAYTSGSFPSAQIAVLPVSAPPPARPLVLLTPGISASRPRWSPDGTQIAFVGRQVALGLANVFVMNADGSGLRQLTRLTSQTVSGTGVTCVDWR